MIFKKAYNDLMWNVLKHPKCEKTESTAVVYFCIHFTIGNKILFNEKLYVVKVINAFSISSLIWWLEEN